MKAVIIDSGISEQMASWVYDGISIIRQDDKFLIDKRYNDEVGHGTAVTQLFVSNIEKIEFLQLYIIKIESDSIYGYDVNSLLYAIDYIKDNIICDLILISSGIRTYNHLLNLKLYNLHKQGTVIFSAFDNLGSMSYPAAFEFVVGVDVSDEINALDSTFICLVNNPINIITANKYYRVKWNTDKKNIVKGSSFSCADIAGKFANYFILSCEENIQNSYYNFIKENSHLLLENSYKQRQDINLQDIERAVVFPFNKEIHAIALNEDLLKFKILDYYDIRQSGKINIEISKILHLNDNRKKIKNIENLNWESDFDTFILGHCDKLEKLVQYDVRRIIVDKCKMHNKFLISLDNVEAYGIDKNKTYYPYVDKSDVPCYNYGKMYITNTPVLGIFGTSSRQGKFTLQLMLRRLFVDGGYTVAQIGTEPTSVLFGMDYVFPMGYNSTVFTKSDENIILLNEYIRRCDIKSPDIIIVGSQSGTCPYNIYNLKLFTLPQIEFLLGTQPDVVVLCANVCDDIQYIKRTIHTIEGVVDCKVIAFALFPRKIQEKVGMVSTTVSDKECQEYRALLEYSFNIPVFLQNYIEVQRLYEHIIDYLS